MQKSENLSRKGITRGRGLRAQHRLLGINSSIGKYTGIVELPINGGIGLVTILTFIAAVPMQRKGRKSTDMMIDSAPRFVISH